MKKILNPFDFLAGEKTLAWGIVGWAATLAAAWAGGESFRGVISSGYAEMPLWKLALQSLAGWAVFSTLLYGAAVLFSRSTVRMIDIFGNQLFARIALLLLFLLGALPAMREVSMQVIAGGNAPEVIQEHMVQLMLFGWSALAVAVFFFVWSWMGFSVAANLSGWKGGSIYIVCYLLAEVISSWLTAALAQ